MIPNRSMKNPQVHDYETSTTKIEGGSFYWHDNEDNTHKLIRLGVQKLKEDMQKRFPDLIIDLRNLNYWLKEEYVKMIDNNSVGEGMFYKHRDYREPFRKFSDLEGDISQYHKK